MSNPSVRWLVQEALDERERLAPMIHYIGCAKNSIVIGQQPKCDCGQPEAILRQVAAERRVFEHHQPMECSHRPRHSVQHIVCINDCDGDWPCPDFINLADRLGIDLEES